MKIKVESLKIGDEVLIPSNSNLKYLKVLKEPQLQKSLDWRGNTYYKSIRCSVGGIRHTKTRTRYNGELVNYTNTDYELDTNVNNHTLKINVDLNHKDIWLVKRENG
jgi:hypothetical protein